MKRRRTKMIVLGLAALGALAGLLSIHRSAPKPDASTSSVDVSSGSTRPAAGQLAAAPVAPNEQLAVHAAAPPPIDDQELVDAEARFDALARGLDPALLARLQTTSALGKRIGRLALFARLGKSLDRTTADHLRSAYLPDVRSRPTESIGEVRGLMAQLDSLQYAEERLSLYSVLTAVPDVRSAMEELSQHDITSMVPPAQPDSAAGNLTIEQQEGALSWPPSRILPLMAYNYFSVATKDDPDLALEGTVEAIVAQADSRIREGMATGFVSTHPDLKADLYKSLTDKRVTVADVQPMPQPSADQDPNQIAKDDPGKNQPQGSLIAAGSSVPAHEDDIAPGE